MKRVLLTGGAGFVGANLCRWLLREGHEVQLLLRPGSNRWRLEPVEAEIRSREVDLEDGEAVERAVATFRPEWVFHLAAYGAYSQQADVRRMVRTNIAGTVNLVESCMATGFEALVNAGSSSEYGFKDHAPAETDVLEPNSHYAWTKAAATHYCRFTGATLGLPIATLRLYAVYGPYEEPGRLMPTLISSALEGGLPPLAGREVARDFVYVEDVCEAFVLTAETASDPGAVYNVGSGVQTTLEELVELVRRRFGTKIVPEWGTMANRSWDTNVWVANNQKIVRELGWKPRHTLDEGLEAFARWFETHPDVKGVYAKA